MINLVPPDGIKPNGERESIDESLIQFSKEFRDLCIKHKQPVACFFIAKNTGALAGGGHKEFVDHLKELMNR